MGARPPITTDEKGEFAGRFISLDIKLASNDRLGKKYEVNKVTCNLILPSSLDNEIYLCFFETLNTLLGQAPAKSEISMGANVNSNIGKLDGLHSSEFQAALGPHGLPRRNKKGENLLHIYLAHRLRVMNTFFETK